MAHLPFLTIPQINIKLLKENESLLIVLSQACSSSEPLFRFSKQQQITDFNKKTEECGPGIRREREQWPRNV